NIADNDTLPIVTITASDANAGETDSGIALNPGQFTFTRTGSTASPLTVNYAIAGTAGNGSDYSLIDNSITFAAGITSVTLPIDIINDTVVEAAETVNLTLAANSAYTVGAANSATVNIADNDTVIAPFATTGSRSGNSSTDALLDPNVFHWNTSLNGGKITYSFLRDAAAGSYYGDETVSEVSDPVKNNVRSILTSLESSLNVDFVEVQDSATNYGVLRYMFSDGPSYTYAYYPSSNIDPRSGDVHFSSNFESDPNKSFSGSPGNFGYQSIIHETFHALGLKHPFEDSPTLLPQEDNNTNTVMTYNDDPPYAGSYAITPMAYDLRSLQYLYGANSNNSGDTTYSFSSVYGYTVNGQFNGSSTTPIKQSLWDSSGNDTLDFSSLPVGNYRFDMNPGGILTTQAAYNGSPYVDYVTEFSYSTSSFGTTLAYDTTIEKLINSPGNDEIIANAAANRFAGYTPGNFTGNDILKFTNSSDVLELSGYSLSDLTPTVSGSDLNIGLGLNGSLAIQNYYGLDGSMKIAVAGNYYTYNASTGWQVAPVPAIPAASIEKPSDGLTSTPASPYDSPFPLSPVYSSNVVNI
ncbi:Calx-beta domain-containing protein, partial [Microseira wollei]|uniref:Calx-beta domain-containing protein n=1 Tax=Microseira wollei TaxID=467598 RepID=UPI0027D99EA3